MYKYVYKINCYVSTFILFLLVAACSTHSSFVVNKKVLDPMTIYSYPSLIVPPVYYLSSREIADERRFMRQNQQQVQSLLFGSSFNNQNVENSGLKRESTYNRNNFSSGEIQLLTLAKANHDFYNIREKVNEDTLGVIKKQSSFINKVFSSNQGEKLDDSFSQYMELNHK